MTQLQIKVDIPSQRLSLWQGDEPLMDVEISTAKNGPGERFGSECTPRGSHIVRAMIGANRPANTVFIGRRPTGELYTSALREQFPERDWILTRILWLSGLELGCNRLGSVDTMRRYIYIHGCPDEDTMGNLGSHGCIKMRNQDVMELFERVQPGTRVFING